MFFSQQQEDYYLFSKFLNYRNGFFIELGAMDGVTYSNSKFFEDNLSWNGILIEPTIDQYQNLIKNRPNCFNFNYAISETDGFVEFLGNHALGGMTHTMTQGHRIGWNLDEKGKPYIVKSIPIKKIVDGVFSKIGYRKIDLFSIDVEGGELEVLKTFDFSTRVDIILIETLAYDDQGREKNESCREFLRNKNFKFDSEVGCNEVWVNKIL